MSEIPIISSQAQDRLAEARIDEMSEAELRNELASNRTARDHFVQEERELIDSLASNSAVQTKLRLRAQAILQRLEEMSQIEGSALPETEGEGKSLE